jgi:tRNA (guanine37-N1)-methyltransferase
MRFDVVTLFESMFSALLEHGITGRALTRQLFEFKAWNPRDFTSDVHRTVDDRPYGGGPGMVMLAEPLLATVNAVRQIVPMTQLVVLSPHGRRFDQSLLLELAELSAITFVCGRYEAIDQRAIDLLRPMEVSLGDFVVSGGELPAMMIMDALIRRLPGAMNTAGSVLEDSFEAGLLDCPHFSRPELLSVDGLEFSVPSVLLSGHHGNIKRWRREQMLEQTFLRRPDLLTEIYGSLSPTDKAHLAKMGYNNRLSSSK